MYLFKKIIEERKEMTYIPLVTLNKLTHFRCMFPTSQRKIHNIAERESKRERNGDNHEQEYSDEVSFVGFPFELHFNHG